MTQPTCPRCARPIPDTAYVCAPCGRWLRTRLDETAALAVEISTTVSRLARTGDPGGRTRPAAPDPPPPARPGMAWLRGDTAAGALRPTPLPYLFDAARDVDMVASVLSTWARHCAGERGHDVPTAGERDQVVAAAGAYLAGQVEWLRHQPYAVEAFDETADACRLLEHVIDRKPDLVLVGQCACNEYLYSRPNAEHVACRACGTSYDVAAARAQMREAMAEALLTAAEIARLALYFGLRTNRDRTRNLINKWAARGIVIAHAVYQGQPAYQFGEVAARLMAADAKAP